MEFGEFFVFGFFGFEHVVIHFGISLALSIPILILEYIAPYFENFHTFINRQIVNSLTVGPLLQLFFCTPIQVTNFSPQISSFCMNSDLVLALGWTRLLCRSFQSHHTQTCERGRAGQFVHFLCFSVFTGLIHSQCYHRTI